MLKCKSLLDYTIFFFLNKYEKNDKIILNYFSVTEKVKIKKSNVLFVVRTEN